VKHSSSRQAGGCALGQEIPGIYGTWEFTSL